MHEKPAEAVRPKPDSSLVRAVRAVADGDADVVVSAGNTGAMLAASLLRIPPPAWDPASRDRRRDPRPARADRPDRRGGERGRARRAPRAVRPHGHGLRRGDPRAAEPEVRLLSIGEEPEKGNQLALEAHALAGETRPRFAGNTEGRVLLEGEADVVVCDGFTGNVALKTLEGTIRSVLASLAHEIDASRGRDRRSADPARRAPSPRAARPGDLRRRLPPRAPRSRRDRSRRELAPRYRERDPPRRARASSTVSSTISPSAYRPASPPARARR